MSHEERAASLGIAFPDFSGGHYGEKAGVMKPHRIANNVLYLGGQVPIQADGTILNPGTVGKDLTPEQALEAARLVGINAVGSIKYALGSLDRVEAILSSLHYVRSDPDFLDVGAIANGCTDVLAAVFGPDAGVGARATIGVSSLGGGLCFESWITVAIKE